MQLMDQPHYQLDNPRRQSVLQAILKRSRDRGWQVLAAHVRSNHVHVVVEGDDEPELMMTQLKSAASRHLNEIGLGDSTTKRWARHGSTRRLWDRDSVLKAIGYVIDGQGEPMSMFEADRSCWSRL
jgi:REP element-mobilizing transposase RayT